MSSGCGDVLSLADLQTAKKHQIFEAEVITGKSGGVAGGVDIDYATNQATGQTQKTLPAVLRDAGFSPVSWDFSIGGTLTVNDRDKVVYDPVSKTWYSYAGTLPVVVPAGFNPVGDADWEPQTDPNLRGNLAAVDGFSLIGASNYADIRNYTGSGTRILCYGRSTEFDGAHGIFALDPTDTTSADNDGTVLVTAEGKRWKRKFTGPFQAVWFGAIGDGVTNSTDGINRLLTAAGTYSEIEFSKGVYLSSGLHSILEGQVISFNNATFKSDGTAATHEFFFVNEDNVTLKGPLTIDGAMREPGENPPEIAIGIRVGNTRQVVNFNCERLNGLGTVYPLFITGAKDSTIRKCYSYRNGDGFRIASVTTGVAEAFGVDNVRFVDCVAEDSGVPYLPASGTMYTGSDSGFKITNVPVSNLVFENCKAVGNCAFGFNIHGHAYPGGLPSGFLQSGIKFINCVAEGNNPPETNLPTAATAPAGIASGFYFGTIGVPVHDVEILNCTVSDQLGEAIYNRSLDDSNRLIGLTVRDLVVTGRGRTANTGVRSTNAVFRFNRAQNVLIDNLTLRNVASLYDFVGYHQNSVGTLTYTGKVSGDTPNFLYAQALTVPGVTSKLNVKGVWINKVANLNSATQAVGARVIDFQEIAFTDFGLQDTATSYPLSFGILQSQPATPATSQKYSNCNIYGTSSTIKISGAAIEVNTTGGSKLFQGNTIGNAGYAFSGNGTENAIIIGNHLITGTVTNPLLNFPTSTIKRGNYGIADS